VGDDLYFRFKAIEQAHACFLRHRNAGNSDGRLFYHFLLRVLLGSEYLRLWMAHSNGCRTENERNIAMARFRWSDGRIGLSDELPYIPIPAVDSRPRTGRPAEKARLTKRVLGSH
jgi:hypothetical protein